ncbi:MAG TPA: ABC transporter substrate-binding protein [Terriglobales bacterium]|nr:ABC transporter substrate-binding protein [Terriglobales bacterium]
MRRSALPLLVATSLLLAGIALGATRPRYGGALRVAVRATPISLDPADSGQPDSFVRRNLSRLIFDTLVRLDDRGRPQAALANSWQPEPGDQRWQFYIRHGVTFQDGAPVTSDAIAASLRVANPNWKVFPTGEAVVIECDSPAPDLPAELALPRNGIAKRDGKLTGSGPFAITRWDPGKKLALTARDDYWGGRALVDSVEIEMGKNFREQMISLDLGKADLIEVAPEQAQRAAMEGRRVESSAPTELMALVFSRDRQSPEDGRLREALALSVDRGSMNTVLLQGGGEPAGGLLPNWMTGYAFLFPTDADLPRAHQARSEVRQAPAWTLGYDASDPVARNIAERIALNARDAGLALTLTTATAADVRLVRIPLPSLDAHIALTTVAGALGLPHPKVSGNSVHDLYVAETALLQSQRVIPLLRLRAASAMSRTVRNWTGDRDGSWRLQDVWLGTEKP